MQQLSGMHGPLQGRVCQLALRTPRVCQLAVPTPRVFLVGGGVPVGPGYSQGLGQGMGEG